MKLWHCYVELLYYCMHTYVTYIRGRHQKRYGDKLHYVLELSHNASALWRKVVASYSYRSGFIEIDITLAQ
jgi:hypothetical protein